MVPFFAQFTRIQRYKTLGTMFSWPWGIGGTLAMAFIVDISLPLSHKDFAFYLLPLLVSNWCWRPYCAYGVALASTLLSLGAVFLSPPGGIPQEEALTYRLWESLLYWLVAYLIEIQHWALNSQPNLQVLRALQTALDPVLVLDGNLTIRFCNFGSQQLLGGMSQEMTGRPIRSVISPHSWEQCERLLKEEQDGPWPKILEFFPSSAGSAVRWKVYRTPLMSLTGSTPHLLLIGDQSQFSNGADTLRDEQRTIAAAWERMEGASTFVYDSRSDVFDFTGQWKELMRVIDTPSPVGMKAWLGLVHPEDRTALEELLRGSLGESPNGGSLNLRIRNQSGTYHSYRLICAPLINQSGPSHKVVGSLQDITQIEHLRRLVRQSRATLQSFFDSTHLLMGVVALREKDIQFLAINVPAARFFGQTPQALVSKSARESGIATDLVDTWVLHLQACAATHSHDSFCFVRPGESPTSGSLARFKCDITFIGENSAGQAVCSFVAEDITKAHAQEEALQQLTRELESRVAARTSELQALTRQLRSMAGKLLTIQESERNSLARDLHDEIGQDLTVVKMYLDTAAQELDPRPNRNVTEATEMTVKLLGKIRGLAWELRPSLLRDLGLEGTLRWYVTQLAKRCQWEMSLDLPSTPLALSGVQCTMAYRIVQEALTNVARHARAHRVGLRVHQSSGQVHVTIVDDGVGFDPARVPASAHGPSGMGLLSMQERARLLGGQLRFSSTAGHGTRLHLTFPVSMPVQLEGEA